MNFKKIIIKMMIVLLFLSLLSNPLSVGAEGLKGVYEVPQGLSSYRNAGISANSEGDILVCSRDYRLGAIYYLVTRTGKKVGPKQFPNQPYPVSKFPKVGPFDIDHDSTGTFHVTWLMNDGSDYRGYYSTFNPVTQKWGNRIDLPFKPYEAVSLRVNSMNDDIAIAYCGYFGAKNIYFGWKKLKDSRFNVSNICPGRLSGVLPFISFDADGYLYLVHKYENWRPGQEEDWLYARLALIDPFHNYKILFYGGVTDTEDLKFRWQFFPTVAVIERKGILIFSYYQGHSYNYLTFERVPTGNKSWTIKTNEEHLDTNILFAPLTWNFYNFSSKAFPYKNEILWVFMAPGNKLYLLKINADGSRITNNPIDLYPGSHDALRNFGACIQPNIGLLTAKTGFSEPSKLFYSIYEHPKRTIKLASPLPNPVRNVSETEKSLFFSNTKYYNIITWQNNLENITNELVITKYKLYRRGPLQKWKSDRLVAEFPQGNPGYVNMTYTDYDMSDAARQKALIYCITCMDDKGAETKLGEFEAISK